jgi:hypothetical protein
MMATSQPGVWVSDPDAYRKKMDDLLDDRDPITVMAETPGILARIVDQHPPDVMRTRPYEDKWSPNEIIGHLVDTEWVYGFRVRLILCEDNPTIVGMDHERWVEVQEHNEREPAELLDRLTSLREHDLAMWRSLGPAELARTGQHNERGPESLGTMLRMKAGHDLSHIDQINRYLEAIHNG